MELVRCVESFPYWLSKYVYILDPPPNGRGIVQWEPWPYLLELVSLFLSQRLLIVLKARQLGVSWLAVAYGLWTALYHPASLVLFISQGKDEAKEMIRKAKVIYDRLPDYLSPAMTRDPLSELHFEGHQSAILALPSTPTAGSGYTARLVIRDEDAKHPYAKESWAALEPTVNAGGQFISLSSAFGVGNWFHQTYIDAKNRLNNFSHAFMHCLLRPGRDEAWYYRTMLDYKGDIARFNQEYPLTDTSAFILTAGLPVFEAKVLTRLAANKKPPLDETVYPLGRLLVWQDPVAGRSYVIGTDVSYGLGAPDKGCSQVLDARTGMHVASLWGSFPPAELVKRTCALGESYNRALVAVEDNGIGELAIRELSDLAYTNVYYRDAQEAYRAGKRPTKMGWHTGSNRHQMIGDLAQGFRAGTLDTWDEFTIGEMQSFVHESGKPQAAAGCRDDRVMALAIAWQVHHQPYALRATGQGQEQRTMRFVGRR